MNKTHTKMNFKKQLPINTTPETHKNRIHTRPLYDGILYPLNNGTNALHIST